MHLLTSLVLGEVDKGCHRRIKEREGGNPHEAKVTSRRKIKTKEEDSFEYGMVGCRSKSAVHKMDMGHQLHFLMFKKSSKYLNQIGNRDMFNLNDTLGNKHQLSL